MKVSLIAVLTCRLVCARGWRADVGLSALKAERAVVCGVSDGRVGREERMPKDLMPLVLRVVGGGWRMGRYREGGLLRSLEAWVVGLRVDWRG